MFGRTGGTPLHALTWQVVDSAFPTGGFAHSLGLEAAWQSGEIAGRDTLGRFTRGAMLQAGYGVLPLATTAFRAPDRLEELDAIADAFLSNQVANRASRVQGRTLSATCQRVWPSHALDEIQARGRLLCGHAAPLTGVVFKAIGLPLWTIQEVVVFAAARGVLSAAVRLGIVGSYEAQQMLSESAADQAVVLDRCAGLDLDGLAHASPIADMFQASHDRLYSRLFQS